MEEVRSEHAAPLEKPELDEIDFPVDGMELSLEDLEYAAGGAPHFPNLTVRP